MIFVNSALEGKTPGNEVVVKIDSSINQENLELLLEVKKRIEERIALLEEIVIIKDEHYNSIKDLKTKSKTEKDRELISLIDAKNSLNLTKSSLAETKLQIAKERDIIKKSEIRVKNLYVDKIYPREGDYLSPGAKIAHLHDLSRGKLTIFVSREDMDNLDSGNIYIDGEKKEVKIIRKSRVADVKNISSYEVVLGVDSREIFSELVKIEIKKEKADE